MSAIQLVLTLSVAAAFGLVAQRLSIPGGIILGSMVGAGIVTLVGGTSTPVPRRLQDVAFIIIGSSIGAMLTRQSVAQLPPVLLPAVLSAVVIIVAGLGIAYMLRLLGIAPPADVLATSPGALSVVAAMAVEQGVGAAEVALFHLVRIVTVILTLPLIVHLLRAAPG